MPSMIPTMYVLYIMIMILNIEIEEIEFLLGQFYFILRLIIRTAFYFLYLALNCILLWFFVFHYIFNVLFCMCRAYIQHNRIDRR